MTHPSFTDISKWEKLTYASTGGTRSKKIYNKPQDYTQYFFKGSKKLDSGLFKYESEFWSEIASSKIGQMLGFNLLDYNIGYDFNDEQQIGSLSKSMVTHYENKLSEGVEYLRGFDPSYDPKHDEERYTLNFIIRAIGHYKLDDSLIEFLKMIVFDASIGNSDRHQENWGFITYFKEAIDEFDKDIEEANHLIKKSFLRISKSLVKSLYNSKAVKDGHVHNISKIVPMSFSPIYDSGCSLGRENTKERIQQMLQDPNMLNSYVSRKGKSEIRWDMGKKPSHFDLLKKVKSHYSEQFISIQEMINEKYSSEQLNDLITNLDKNLPEELKRFRLADYRKELMIKIVTLRIDVILGL